MYQKTKSGHIDGDLCCGMCGTRGPWQPEDKSPCVDDWWCRGCTEWHEPNIFVKCGPNPWMIHYYDKQGQSQLRSVCNEYGIKPKAA